MTGRVELSDALNVNSDFKEKFQQNAVKSSDFSSYFWNAYYDVDALQKDAEQKAFEVSSGKAESFHDAVIAMEKASIALQLLVQMQNKLVDAYQEIMRMSI